jgi:D-glycero-alpha-D-manno-heptose 1-phosphate guanylyltransferase
MEACCGEDVVVVNGDSFFDVDLPRLCAHHCATRADATLALRKIADVGRYGSVDLDGTRIKAFSEKSVARQGSGLINGGLYVLNRTVFLKHTPQDAPFSLEADFLGPNCRTLNFQAIVSDGYFIDIGIPDDYHRAQNEFADFPY